MLRESDSDTIGDMALHAAILGGVIFGYMIIFGHGLPTELRGPLFTKDW